MNNNRQPMDINLRKKANKEIKNAQKNFFKKEVVLQSDVLHVEEEIKKYPKKIANKEKCLLTAFKKNMEIKKKKQNRQRASKGASKGTSKRTTPGMVEGQPSSPAHPHVEGQRWNQTLNLQNRVKKKALTLKLNKKR